jgi:hypothetical protein
MKIIFIILISAITLFGVSRDNPFVSVENKEGVINTKTNNKVYLDSESIDIPDSARKINKITIEYINSDGSITIAEPIEMNLVYIDPDKPLIFSQKSLSNTKPIKKQSSKPIYKSKQHTERNDTRLSLRVY